MSPSMWPRGLQGFSGGEPIGHLFSKCGHVGRRASVEASLKDLCCGTLDLLLLHWPEAWLPGTHVTDTTVTLNQTWCGG